jgi:hypothetical protein
MRMTRYKNHDEPFDFRKKKAFMNWFNQELRRSMPPVPQTTDMNRAKANCPASREPTLEFVIKNHQK